MRHRTRAFVATTLLVACNAILGNQEAERATEAGGSSTSSASSSGASSSGAPIVLPPEDDCALLHVDARSGDDENNTGCLPSAPKRTLTAALAQAAGTDVARVRVCAGT